MKAIKSYLFVLVVLASTSLYSQPTKYNISKGTVLTYNIKESNNTYRYTATLTKFSETDGIEFKWQTNQQPASSGKCSMPFKNLSAAIKLLIKPVNGDETLGNDQLRFFFNSDQVGSLVVSKLLTIEIDGKSNDFLYIAQKAETQEVEYSGKKSSMDYISGDAGTVSIGFIEIGDYELVQSFRANDLKFDLLSITTTTEKAAIQNQKIISPFTSPLPAHIKKEDVSSFTMTCLAYPMLSLVERFDPTDNGKFMYPFKETYDYRASTNMANPPTWVDAFIVDLNYIYKHKEQYPAYITSKAVLGPKKLLKPEILQIFQVYLNSAAKDIVGYRPWTHARFVQSLSESDRDQLATEAQTYIERYGFKEK